MLSPRSDLLHLVQKLIKLGLCLGHNLQLHVSVVDVLPLFGLSDVGGDHCVFMLLGHCGLEPELLEEKRVNCGLLHNGNFVVASILDDRFVYHGLFALHKFLRFFNSQPAFHLVCVFAFNLLFQKFLLFL